MTTQSKEQLEMNLNIKNYVNCGGYQWTQIKIDDATWYLINESKNVYDVERYVLMPNKCFASLLKIDTKRLSKLYCGMTQHGVYHDDAPTSFVPPGTSGKGVHKTRQLMWTLDGMHSILDVLKTKGVEVDDAIRAWLWEHRKEFERKQPSPENQPTVSSCDVIETNKAVNYITQIINQLKKTTIRHDLLQKEVKKLKADIEALTSKPRASSPVVTPSAHLTGGVKPYTDKVDSLSELLSKSVSVTDTDRFTKVGLFNSDQIYSTFAHEWIDPKTKKLINKNKFYAILRYVFHKSNSSHRAPVLKASAIRENYALVCQIFCKKKSNPLDAEGNALDLENPAYLSNKHPCVRLQARYTSNAIHLLISRWKSYVNHLFKD